MAKKPTYEELEQRVNRIEKKLLEQSSLESALRKSEELLKATIESTVDGILVVAPPEPLPARSETAQVRLEAIFQQLSWWADYYTSEMEAALAGGA